MDLTHDDIGDISLALRYRIVQVERKLDGQEIDAEDREDYAQELVRLKALIKRVDAERPAAQRLFLEREF